MPDLTIIWKLLWKLVKFMKPDRELQSATPDLTVQLNRGAGASQEARDRLASALYPELKRIARAHMRRERPDHTLQATALVNELYLQLLRRSDLAWTDRNHFLLAASQAMHRLLVDYARARGSRKRGGDWSRLELDDLAGSSSAGHAIEILEFDGLLSRLAKQEPRMARVVELKYFGGLTFAEIGAVLGVDERTAKRDWTLARAWLRGQLGSNDSSGVGEN
jgi:RNA polymerase sigma factor (TIGR02999 family)